MDGHNSHYTHAFLEFARAHRIEIVGYPSHSTHVYQGLDVVIFGPLKHNWSMARDSWEQRGHTVDKTNFLAVYAEAHAKTLTPENIKAAFRKTGVIPFNPDVVTEEMMAPSLATSMRSMVPIQQSSAVKAVSEMVIDYVEYQKIQASAGESSSRSLATSRSASAPIFMQSAINSLNTTSAAFLISSSTISSTSVPPMFIPSTISPPRPSRYQELLGKPTSTVHEQVLRDTLLESEVRAEMRKEMMTEMQAGIVLANLYTSRVQGQLHAAEQKRNKKGQKRLMGDGKAKYFSGDDFYTLCVEDEQRRKDEEVAAKEREVSKQNHAEALAAWNKINDAIRRRNKDKKDEYTEALTTWEAERDVARAEKRRVCREKPKWKDWKPEKLLPRPKKHTEDDDDDDENDGDGGDDEMD